MPRAGSLLALAAAPIALLAAALSGAGCQGSDHEPSGLPATTVPAAAEVVHRAARAYDDVLAEPAAARTYHAHAGRLLLLQRRLAVAESVARSVRRAAASGAPVTAAPLDGQTLGRVTARAEGDVNRVRERIEGALRDAERDGAP